MNAIITIDIGTTSIRSILFNQDGKALFVDKRANPPVFHADGRVEQEPDTWLTLISSLLKTTGEYAAKRGISINGIALTAQRSSVIPVDGDGKALRPAIMWQDTRTAPLAEELAPHRDFVFSKTGLRISPVFSALKMLWIRREEPQVYARARKLIGIQDFVVHFLTGRYATDHTFASRTNLLDLTAREWDPDLLSLFQVDCHKLCELVPPGSIMGGLTAEAAELTSLKAGTPVISAGGDQQCAALGLGLLSSDSVVANTGTGSYAIGHVDRPAIDPRMRLSCNASAIPGAYILEAAVLTSGTVYRWFNDTILRGAADGADPFAALDAEAAASRAGSNGVILIPHFSGSGTPHWDTGSRGMFYNLSLNTTRGDLARAILEGIAFELRESIELMEATGGPVRAVRVSGGMANSQLFNQIQADVFSRSVVRYEDGEATSLGAWMAAAVALGFERDYESAFERATKENPPRHYEPNLENSSIYETRRRQAKGLYEALAAPDFRRLFIDSLDKER